MEQGLTQKRLSLANDLSIIERNKLLLEEEVKKKKSEDNQKYADQWKKEELDLMNRRLKEIESSYKISMKNEQDRFEYLKDAIEKDDYYRISTLRFAKDKEIIESQMNLLRTQLILMDERKKVLDEVQKKKVCI